MDVDEAVIHNQTDEIISVCNNYLKFYIFVIEQVDVSIHYNFASYPYMIVQNSEEFNFTTSLHSLRGISIVDLEYHFAQNYSIVKHQISENYITWKVLKVPERVIDMIQCVQDLRNNSNDIYSTLIQYIVKRLYKYNILYFKNLTNNHSQILNAAITKSRYR